MFCGLCMSPGGDEGELLRNMDEVSPGHWSWRQQGWTWVPQVISLSENGAGHQNSGWAGLPAHTLSCYPTISTCLKWCWILFWQSCLPCPAQPSCSSQRCAVRHLLRLCENQNWRLLLPKINLTWLCLMCAHASLDRVCFWIRTWGVRGLGSPVYCNRAGRQGRTHTVGGIYDFILDTFIWTVCFK